ncbi:MAG TPA: GNAT family N-acetyltransferase [Pyrinomonadaceae bacterium]|nr:GNAT family N-acetyltransferase [Pyrinomonadaceae bacterium]
MPQEEIAARVTLRPAADDDEEFLVKVYGSTREDELARVPWSEAQRAAFVRMQFDAQQLHYRTHNPAATYHVILLDGRAAGRLYVARRGYEIRILDITLLPEHRGGGAGTFLIKGLMDEASRAGQPLNIYVESYNRSRRLFERLGFKKVDRPDDDGVNYLLEWRSA